MLLTKQLDKIQRSLCTPLEAVAYTNEFLIVSGGVATFAILLLASFVGNIDTMSDTLGRINELKQEMLHEKIDILSSEIVGTEVLITLTNYGKHDTLILAVFSDVGVEVICLSNNADSANMTIISGGLLEITCPLLPNAQKMLVVTNTHSILVAEL